MGRALAPMLRRVPLLAVLLLVGCSGPRRIDLSVQADEIVVAWGMACARSATAVHCWGPGKKPIWSKKPGKPRPITRIGAPKRVVIAADAACVLDMAGAVSCVTGGDVDDLATLEPAQIVGFRSPVDLIGTRDVICALEAEGTVACVRGPRPPGANASMYDVVRPPLVTKASALHMTVDRLAFCVRQDDEHRCFTVRPTPGEPSKLEESYRVKGLVAPVAIDLDDFVFVAIDEGKLKTIVRSSPPRSGADGLLPIEIATEDPKIGPARALTHDSIWRVALSNGAVKTLDPHFNHGEAWPLGKPADALWGGPSSLFFVRHGDELWQYRWKKGVRQASRVRGVRQPRMVGFNLFEACALADGGVSCWTLPEDRTAN